LQIPDANTRAPPAGALKNAGYAFRFGCNVPAPPSGPRDARKRNGPRAAARRRIACCLLAVADLQRALRRAIARAVAQIGEAVFAGMASTLSARREPRTAQSPPQFRLT